MSGYDCPHGIYGYCAQCDAENKRRLLSPTPQERVDHLKMAISLCDYRINDAKRLIAANREQKKKLRSELAEAKRDLRRSQTRTRATSRSLGN